jgi:hypothetical protein
MNGNFDERQGLKHNDRTVDAQGWIEWAADDVSAAITITLRQDDDCEAQAPGFISEPPSNTWQVDVTRGSQPWWKRGAASGSASAVVTKQDGSTEQVDWDSPPLTLH